MESRPLSRSSYVSVAGSSPDQVTQTATSSESALFIRVPAVKPSGEHDSTLRTHENRNSGRCLNADEGRSPRKGRSKIMPLIQLLEILVVVGILLWLVNRFIPMQGSIKSILNGVVVIAVVLWLLNVFGLFHSLTRIHVGT
jgi:hypothetical protein